MFRCSFCGKLENQVRRMLYGTNGYICNECVMVSYQMLLEDGDIEPEVDSFDESDLADLPKPLEIKKIGRAHV